MSAPLSDQDLLLRIKVDLVFPFKRYAYGDVFRRENQTMLDIDHLCNLMLI